MSGKQTKRTKRLVQKYAQDNVNKIMQAALLMPYKNRFLYAMRLLVPRRVRQFFSGKKRNGMKQGSKR